MFERYTPEALQVVFFARLEASHYRSQELDTAHLMLGVIRKDRGFARLPRVSEIGEALRHLLKDLSQGAPPVSMSQDVPLSEECKRVLTFASDEADNLNHPWIGCEHMLIGMIREESGTISAMLRDRGITLESLRERTRANPPSGPLPSPLDSGEVSYSPSGYFGQGLRGPIPFSRSALEALALADKEFRLSGEPMLQPKHLLIGALKQEEAYLQLFIPDGASIEQIRKELSARQVPAQSEKSQFSLFIPSEESEQVFDFAAEEAQSLHQEKIEAAHLLLGILHLNGNPAAQLLRRHGANRDDIRSALTMRPSGPASDPGPSTPPQPEP